MNGAELISRITEHMSRGGSVQISTYTKSTIYAPKYINMFKVGADGSPLVQRGKNWDDIRYCSIRLLNS